MSRNVLHRPELLFKAIELFDIAHVSLVFWMRQMPFSIESQQSSARSSNMSDSLEQFPVHEARQPAAIPLPLNPTSFRVRRPLLGHLKEVSATVTVGQRSPQRLMPRLKRID